MTLPTFLGIGVQKGGTSWLHNQLMHHPEVFIPRSRKEIHYFDWYYDKGITWYQKWFPDNSSSFKAIGEITPEYIYFDSVLPKIKQTFNHIKFIVVLRDPVDRAYSHYQMIFQSGEGFKYKNFDDFMTRHPHGYKRGLYGEQLSRWFKEYNPDNFLILLSEDLSSTEENLIHTYNSLGQFLGINPDLFDKSKAYQKIGEARVLPKYPLIVKMAQLIRQKLRDWDMDHIAFFLKKIGITRQIFKGNKHIPPLDQETRDIWMKKYKNDIAVLEKILNRSFSQWQ